MTARDVPYEVLRFIYTPKYCDGDQYIATGTSCYSFVLLFCFNRALTNHLTLSFYLDIRATMCICFLSFARVCCYLEGVDSCVSACISVKQVIQCRATDRLSV